MNTLVKSFSTHQPNPNTEVLMLCGKDIMTSGRVIHLPVSFSKGEVAASRGRAFPVFPDSAEVCAAVDAGEDHPLADAYYAQVDKWFARLGCTLDSNHLEDWWSATAAWHRCRVRQKIGSTRGDYDSCIPVIKFKLSVRNKSRAGSILIRPKDSWIDIKHAHQQLLGLFGKPYQNTVAALLQIPE